MNRGYVKLWRALLEKPIWIQSTPEQKAVLIAVLLMGNYRPHEWEWGGEKFKVKQGQFVTSLESIKEKAGKGVSIQNVRSSLKRFEKLQFLTNKSTKLGRLISIINWDDYQPDKSKGNKEPNKDPTKTQHLLKKERINKNKDIGYPSWLNIALWSEFKKYRIKIKAPLTNHAEKLCIADLKKVVDSGHHQAGVINQTIMSGKWKSFYPVKNTSIYGSEVKQVQCPKCKIITPLNREGKPCNHCGEVI